MCEGTSRGKWQPFAKEDGVDSGGYRARLQSDRIWEERSCKLWFGTEKMGRTL